MCSLTIRPPLAVSKMCSGPRRARMVSRGGRSGLSWMRWAEPLSKIHARDSAAVDRWGAGVGVATDAQAGTVGALNSSHNRFASSCAARGARALARSDQS
eukprot:572315-Pyramimonas_sp.AAC.1